MVKIFLFAGQSNAQGYGNRGQLNPVPSWAQTAGNGWTGAPTVSSDSGFQYQHPTLANSPSLYVESNSGSLSSMPGDGWGSYDGQNPPTGFHPGEQGSYGPELSFLAKYRAAHPTEQIAAIKCVLGGTNILDWLPPNSQSVGGSAAAGTMWPVLAAMISQAAARLTAAGLPFEWAGFVWLQGENGTKVYDYLYPTAGQTYADKLRYFLAAVRGITSPLMPCIIGRVGNQMLASAVIGTQSSGIDTPANRIAACNFTRDQQVVVAADPGNGWWSEDDLPTLQTGTNPALWYHHTSAGYLAAGERAYAAFAGAIPPPPPPPPLQVVVKFDAVTDTSKTATVTLNGSPVGGPGDVLIVDVEDAA